MTQLSRKAKYALRALYALARTSGTSSGTTGPRPTRAEDLAAAERIPHKFLESILLELTHAGLLESRRGRGGGYLLCRRPEDIAVGDVIRLIDGPLAPVPCLLAGGGRCEGCPGNTACGTRRVMDRVAGAIAAILDATTIADASAEAWLDVSSKLDS